MRCFEHRSTEAIGICRGCGKAVCEECFTDTGVGLACRPECAATVRTERALLLKSSQVFRGGHVFTTVMGSLFAVPSGVFALGHVLAGDFAAALPWLPFTALGVLFVAWGRHNRMRQGELDSSRTPRLPEPATHDDRT